MEANNFFIKAGQGKNSTLDKAYYRHINNLIETLDEEKEGRWETYNMIIQELINEGKSYYFNEIKYRLTDGEDPNTVMLDIIERDGETVSGLIWFLKRRIEEYLEDDYLRRFYE
jgi:hypothetical protein